MDYNFKIMEYSFKELYKKMDKLSDTLAKLKGGKKRNHIYLAGSISRDVRTYEWREEFETLMGDDPNFVIVNPCKNKFNQSLRSYKGDNIEFIKEAVARSQGILKPKDRKLIEICNAIVVNLEIYVNSKQPLATFFELCWAEDLMIPVIGIMGDARNWTPPTKEERIIIAQEYIETGSIDHIPMENIFVKHPWVDDAVSAWVKTTADAVKFVKEFFGEY